MDQAVKKAREAMDAASRALEELASEARLTSRDFAGLHDQVVAGDQWRVGFDDAQRRISEWAWARAEECRAAAWGMEPTDDAARLARLMAQVRESVWEEVGKYLDALASDPSKD